MMTRVPIGVAFDDNYAIPGMVTILSLLENAKDSTFYEIKVFCEDSLSQDNKNRITKYIESHWKEKATIELIELNGAFDNAPTRFHLSKVAYYRLLMHNFLDLDKIIWCDVDTIIRGDFSDLYNTDLEGHYIGACVCASAIVNPDECFFKGNSFNHTYFSSGVMLVDLDKFRKEKIENEFFKVIERHGEELLFLDQDVLNQVIKGNYKELPWRYNSYCDIYKSQFGNRYYKKIKEIYDDKYLAEEFNNVVVSHYEGSNGKPWTKKGFRKEWFNIAMRTPFKKDVIKMYKEVKPMINIKSYTKKIEETARQMRRKACVFSKRRSINTKAP